MEVFVYGTLTDPGRAGSLLDGAFAFGPDATLRGMGRATGRYPTLVPDPAGRVEGRILRTGRVEALDRYEGVDRGLYVRVPVPVAGDDRAAESRTGTRSGSPGETGSGAQQGTVETYVGDPDRLGVGSDVEWPGTGDLGERVRSYVDREGVAVHLGE